MQYVPIILILGLTLLLPIQKALAQENEDNSVKIQEVFSQKIPKRNYHKVDVLTVQFAPGDEANKHTHEVGTLVYVLEGVVENQLKGQQIKIFKQGDMWWEPPGTVHLIARNASETERAKLLVFHLDEEDTPHSVSDE